MPPTCEREKSNGRCFMLFKFCKKCRKGAGDYFSEYCNNTSLHGLKYVGGERRTILEKCLWLVLFATAVIGCAILIKKTYDKWEMSPVIVSFDHNPIPVWEVPFPAVTICPQNKAKQTVQNFTELARKYFHKNISENELKVFGKTFLVCDFLSSIIELESGTDFENETVLHFLMDIAPTAEDIFARCRWNNKDLPCDEMFAPTLNEDGICFTFNMLEDDTIFSNQTYFYDIYRPNVTMIEDWDIENGYPPEADLESYPKRVLAAGIKSGLEIWLAADEADLDYLCKNPVQGFKVILHEPGDISRGRTQYIRVPLDQELAVALEPHLMITSENLRNYSPDKRKCYFQNEYNLQFFQRYSQSNCELECLTNATTKNCSCAAFYMPRNETTPICGSGQLRCTMEVEQNLLTVQYKQGKKGNERTMPCDCLPACFSLSYGAETSQSDFLFHDFLNSMHGVTGKEFIGEKGHKYLSMLRIFFKETQFIGTERSELYGVTDFLSNCGGIFGLFTGFSILSLMEIIYYLTVRVWINKYWLGGRKEIDVNKYSMEPEKKCDNCK